MALDDYVIAVGGDINGVDGEAVRAQPLAGVGGGGLFGGEAGGDEKGGGSRGNEECPCGEGAGEEMDGAWHTVRYGRVE